MANQPRVVILGGGFGGLYAAQTLKHAQANVTVIDKRNFHLFQPLLYQVATGSLSPGEIAAPIRSVLSKQDNTNVLLGEAVDIDPSARTLALKDGSQVPYDFLIVATGSQATFFGHDQWRPFAPPLKSVEDATEIRHKILVAFEEAERATSREERHAWLTFVIVGAGATGVELAGALGEIAHHTLKHDFRSIKPSDATILLVDGTSRLLSAFPEDLARRAQRSLENLGVTMRFEVLVDSVDESGVTVKDKSGKHEHIRSKTIIWAAGVAVSDFARQLAKRTGAETDRTGHIKVDNHLAVPNYPEIFVVGDLAYYLDDQGKTLPGVAQVAMQGGSYAAKAIMRRIEDKPEGKPFTYFNKGDLAVIGRAAAIANIFGFHLSGFPAWLVWLFVHLLYIVEFQSRLLVLVQWGFLYLTYNRGARLITGSVPTEESVSRPPAATSAAG
jgi:NADH dehydrogenase